MHFITPEQARWPFQNDLLISNYALSEVNKSLADIYINNYLIPALRGYLTCNYINPACYTKEEYMKKLPGSVAVAEFPITHPDNYILTWRNPCADFISDSLRLPARINAA